MKNKIKSFLSIPLAAAIVFAVILLIAMSGTVSESVRKSILICTNTIIPSLFGAMVFTDLFINTGAGSLVFKPIYFLLSRILNISSDAFAAFVLGNFGGYPIGARLLSNMVNSKNISKQEAQKIMCCSYSSGPAFIIGVVSGIVHDTKIALILWASILTSNFVLLILLSAKRKNPGVCGKSKSSVRISSEMIIKSVRNSSSAMVTICSMIVFFSVIKAIIYEVIPIAWSNPLIAPILEISTVTAVENARFGILPLICAELAFGGVCVILQVIAVTANSFSLKRFFLTRPLHIIFSVLIFKLFSFLFDIQPSITAANISTYSSLSYDKVNIIPVVCIFFMIIILFTQKRQAE